MNGLLTNGVVSSQKALISFGDRNLKRRMPSHQLPDKKKIVFFLPITIDWWLGED
jgi:hypothetical protein